MVIAMKGGGLCNIKGGSEGDIFGKGEGREEVGNRSILVLMNNIINLGVFRTLSIDHVRFFVPGDGVGGEPEAEANSAPEIVEQPPREVAAVINEKLLIPLEATGAQLRYSVCRD